MLQAGKTATGIKILTEIIENLRVGKKPPVKVTINGFIYRSIAVMGGAFMVGLSAENRTGAKVNGGDKIEVTIELDTEERVLEFPADFQKVLNKNLGILLKFFLYQQIYKNLHRVCHIFFIIFS